MYRDLRFEELKTERMDCPDKHLGEARNWSQYLAAASDDSLLQFCRSFFCEGEGYDIARG
jgi:hypothetical protein